MSNECRVEKSGESGCIRHKNLAAFVPEKNTFYINLLTYAFMQLTYAFPKKCKN